MIKAEEVYKIGRLGKAHGVKGEVSFHSGTFLHGGIPFP